MKRSVIEARRQKAGERKKAGMPSKYEERKGIPVKIHLPTACDYCTHEDEKLCNVDCPQCVNQNDYGN